MTKRWWLSSLLLVLTPVWTLIRRWWFRALLLAAAAAWVAASFARGFAEGVGSVVALGTLGAVAVALFGDWFRAKWLPPRLRLEICPPSFTPLLTVCPQTGEVKKVGDAWYFGIRICNLRAWRKATNCRAMLAQVHRVAPDGTFRREPIIVPLQLQWAIPQLNPILGTVSSDGLVFDFGRLVRGADAFEPVLYQSTLNFRSTVRANEAVWYSIYVAADDLVVDGYQVFEVFWDGAWSNEPDRIGEHVRIRPVPEEEVRSPRGLKAGA